MFLSVASLWCSPAEIQSSGPDLNRLTFGLSATVIEGNLNREDVLASVRVWASKFGASSSSWKDTDGAIFTNTESIQRSLTSNKLDVIVMATHEYLQAASRLSARPALAYQHDGQIDLDYVLLVRRDSGISSPSQLAGKRIAMPNSGRHCLAVKWCDTLMSRDNVIRRERLAYEQKVVRKTTQAILPVFFGQLEGGIVIRSAFETAAALNPQIGQQIKILASSPRLVPVLVCFRNSIPEERKMKIRESALRLHETPGGFQTLAVSRLDRMVPWQQSYADGVVELLKQYERLSGSLD